LPSQGGQESQQLKFNRAISMEEIKSKEKGIAVSDIQMKK
jgi:hypothetical protein